MDGGSSRLAGILLTGSASRRLGTDKATLVVDGEPLAARQARLLGQVCEPCVEVGPGASGLRAVRERPAGAGPLAAVAAGAEALRRGGHRGGALAVAVDLPRLTPDLLRFLAGFPGDASVIPFVGGRAQPLCARYSRGALDVAERLASAGEHAMGALLGSLDDVQWAGPRMWGSVASPEAFADVDTPDDAERLGLRFGGPGMVEQ
ncbi:MAG TPA: molybdenum cofactor guanylyltransferase [Actinomycetota bacterium]|nr:molybdenum cofactor guanylyltransferase [Actinomycetota bacterium]